MRTDFFNRLAELEQRHEALQLLPNEEIAPGNGIFKRYKHPVVTAKHTPIFWRYDLNPQSNPHLMERFIKMPTLP